LLFAVLGAACGSAPTVPGADPAAQLRFGVDMARRGLWREAMFRFEQARELRPGDGEVLNDLAISYEAVGRFDDALATYKEALRLAPANPKLKKNYARFLEFYQGYTAGREPAGESEAPPAPAARGAAS
jgi:Flp pilus assembly protein TadD